MEILFIILALFTIAATTVKFIKQDVWWIRMFDFPQAQFTFLGFISLGGLALYWDTSWYYIALLVVLIGCIIYQLTIIIPYTFIHPVQVMEGRPDEDDQQNFISIVVCNVYQYNKQFKKCVDVVVKADSDIILAVETDERWQKEFSAALDDKYPYRCLNPLDNTYGMLLYSKLKLEDTEIKFIIQEDVPSIHTYVYLRSGSKIKMFLVHPEPPSPTENERSTERDAELLLVGKAARKLDLPVIVAGDLNDVAWSTSTKMFQRVSGLLDPRIGRGFYNTFHAKYPLLRWPLDHIFHSDHFKIFKLRRLNRTGSDHFPIYVKLFYSASHQAEQDKPEPDKDDKEEATEKIEEARSDN